MVAGLEKLRNEIRVDVEVDAVHGRVRRKTRAIQHHQLEPLAERPLRAPRPTAPDDAAVDKNEAPHPGI